MRLGFQYPSPFERIQHHRYGEDGWTVSIRQRGDRWVYSSTDARACFDETCRPAELYVDHPGAIGVFARLHLALGTPTETVLDSAQVAALINGAAS